MFGPEADQGAVFEAVSPLVRSALDGYNVSVIAYGQTGAGKTYTVVGEPNGKHGVLPRAIEMVYATLDDRSAARELEEYVFIFYSYDTVVKFITSLSLSLSLSLAFFLQSHFS